MHEGNITVTEAGTTIDSLDVHGSIIVKAADVTIKNSIVRGRAGAGGALVNNLSHSPNLVINDSEILAGWDNRVSGIMGSDFTATRVNIHDVTDQIHLTAGNVAVSESWLHGNLHLEQDPLRDGTPTHDDSIQIQAGTNISFTGNTITDAHNAVMMITQDTGKVGNVSFSGNTADGGACSINVAEKGRGPIVGLTVTDNVFGRNTGIANCAIIAPTTTQITTDANTYTDGAAVAVRKG